MSSYIRSLGRFSRCLCQFIALTCNFLGFWRSDRRVVSRWAAVAGRRASAEEAVRHPAVWQQRLRRGGSLQSLRYILQRAIRWAMIRAAAKLAGSRPQQHCPVTTKMPDQSGRSSRPGIWVLRTFVGVVGRLPAVRAAVPATSSRLLSMAWCAATARSPAAASTVKDP